MMRVIEAAAFAAIMVAIVLAPAIIQAAAG